MDRRGRPHDMVPKPRTQLPLISYCIELNWMSHTSFYYVVFISKIMGYNRLLWNGFKSQPVLDVNIDDILIIVMCSVY